MRNRIERLRVWLLVGAGLLVAVLVVFIGSARYLRRHLLARLPAKLGVDIRSETNGFTYSQSVQGRTIYTIHASREVEHADGKITLHQVSMVLYGRKGDRADRVSGDEFEYDRNAGIVRAIGTVHIDLGGVNQSSSPHPAAQPGREEGAENDPKLLHATTSGLVYLEKLGVAATSEAIDFETGQIKGHAVGADYDTDTGVLMLHSAVDASGTANGRPVKLSAAAAQLEDRGQRVVLTRARYESEGKSAESDHAVLTSRQDNTLEHIDAQGNVALHTARGTLFANHADIAMAEKNRIKNANFAGAVRYTADERLRQARGEASEARVAFTSDGAPEHALFTGSVHLIERIRRSEDARAPWSVRDLAGQRVELALASVGKTQSQVQDATVTGNAHLVSVDAGDASGARGRGTTELAGETLTAHLTPAKDPRQPATIDTVSALGHTLLRQVNADGLEQTSTGDTLQATLRPASGGKGRAGGADGRVIEGAALGAGEELASALQQGHVQIARRVPAKSGAAPDVQQGTAERAAYDGDRDRLTLTGAVRLADTGSVLWAQRVELDRQSGDAHAEGGVKGSFEQQPARGAKAAGSRAGADPVHVVAERADMNHAADAATFYGAPVRMWQGGSQVQAPIIEVARRTREMRAHGTTASAVTAILVSQSGGGKSGSGTSGGRAPAASPAKPNAASSRTEGGERIVRVHSHELVYSNATRTVAFSGGVRIDSAGEQIRSQDATAYLAPSSTGSEPDPASTGGSPQGLSLDGRVERVIATGAVNVDETGRRATGERIVYTSADGLILLTGTRSSPPRLFDTAQGTSVTAAAFRFHIGDESVEALSAVPGEAADGSPVRTEGPVKH